MGLFDKKYCDFCGSKIGLLGNKKLEDGNMCKDCASKLSPWFNERRQSTIAEIKEQLAYREENRKAVADFHTTRSIGRHTRLLIDEDAKKFMVTSSSKLLDANPDILSYDQVTGCKLDIDESRHELKTQDQEGKSVSYDPPRYEYSYDFHVEASVSHPYFDRLRWSLSNGYVKTGESPMPGTPEGGSMAADGSVLSHGAMEYNEYLRLGNEIKAVLDAMRLGESLPTEEELAVTQAIVEPGAVPGADGYSAIPNSAEPAVVPTGEEFTPVPTAEPAAAAPAVTGLPSQMKLVVCPNCGIAVWAKSDGLRLLCLDCGQQMKYV